MNAVEMAAKTTNPLRRNACRVSLRKYSTLRTVPVHPPLLVADHLPAGQLDHPAAHRVDDRVVVRGHHHGGARFG